MRQGKRRLMTKTRIDEISAVDFPAMEGARALLVKRREGAPEGDGDGVDKCGEYVAPITVVTTEENGHTHLLRIFGSERGGETSFARAPNSVEETDHAHPWSMDAEGNVTIGSNDGHTHAVSQRALVQSILALMKRAAKNSEPMPELAPELLDLVKVGRTYPEDEEDDGDPMTTKTANPDTNAGEVEKLRAELSVAKALAALTDAEKAFHQALPEGDRAGFLAKSADERKAMIDAAARKASDADPVVYVSPVTKREFRRSAGEDVIDLAKRADASEERARKADERALDERCEKRAGTELARYPGEIAVRAAIVKALEGIPDASVRKAAFESIAAGNAALGGTFEKRGSTFGGSAPMTKDAAVAKLDELAKARQREKGGDFFDAYDAVKSENPDLYRTAVTGAA